MKYNGTVTVEKGLTLTNPTIESQEVKELYDVNPFTGENIGESLGSYVEIHYKGEGETITHSRSYPVE